MLEDIKKLIPGFTLGIPCIKPLINKYSKTKGGVKNVSRK